MSADLDRILTEDGIVPSAGFTASVMEAVQRQATVPPPIPFPWRRALPGLVAACCVLGLLVTGLIGFVRAPGADPQVLDVRTLVHLLPRAGGGVYWTAVALLASVGSTLVSFSFARQRT